MTDLLFNYNLTDITPEEPVLLGGFANRKGLSGKVHRPLTSRCLVLKKENTIACLVVNDLMDVDPAIIKAIADRIAHMTGISSENILITSIHTHSAPDMEYGRHDANDRYIAHASQRIADNAINTLNDLSGFRFAGIKTGKALCRINMARRDVKPEGGGLAYRIGDPDGLRDEEVGILQLSDEDGSHKVTLFNYSCHPVTLGYESLYVSTDYPGSARETVEKSLGGMAVFVNGAAGDLNPREAHHSDPVVTDQVGEQLGRAVAESRLIEYLGEADLKTTAGFITVPFRDQNITRKHIAAEAKRKADDITEFFTWKDMLKRWESKVYEMIDRGEVKSSFRFRVNAWKLGKTIVFFTQGELFVKYQIELKKIFPGYNLICIAYVHGIGAYIPTADVFEKKGYEADQSYIYEVMPSPLSDRIEEIYMNGVTKMISRLIEA
jgi:hypothetical protein